MIKLFLITIIDLILKGISINIFPMLLVASLVYFKHVFSPKNYIFIFFLLAAIYDLLFSDILFLILFIFSFLIFLNLNIKSNKFISFFILSLLNVFIYDFFMFIIFNILNINNYTIALFLTKLFKTLPINIIFIVIIYLICRKDIVYNKRKNHIIY